MFGRPHPPAAPPRTDDDTLDLDPTHARARLAELPGERLALHTAHLASIGPLLREREGLLARLSELDNALSTAGVHHQDRLRQLDREADRLGVLLPAVGPGSNLEDDVPDPKAVNKLVERLRADPEARSKLVPSTATQIAAADQVDAEEADLVAWGKLARQSLNATGESDPRFVPDCAKHWPRQRVYELTGVHLPG